jgi:transcriptional antiterminator
LNDTQKKIIEYLEKNEEANTYDLMKYLKLTERTVQRNIRLLNGIIGWTSESMSDPKGKYTLIKKQ